MECRPFGVVFVLDYQVNNLGDVSHFIGSPIYIVAQDFSRQPMGLYVLRPDEFDVNEMPVAPESMRASTDIGVLLSTCLWC